MTNQLSFINLITKLTEDFNVHKRHCFKFGSKQLTNKLLGSLEKTLNRIRRSIESVENLLKNDEAEYFTRIWGENVELVLEKENYFCQSDYLKFIRLNYQDFQILVREYARKKLIDSEKLDKIIGQFPEYALKTPEFPLHLAFLGILDDDDDDEEFSFRDKTVPELIEYYKKNLQKLMDDKKYIDAVRKSKLETYIIVQELSLEEIRKTQAFLRENSIDHISTVRSLGRFCKNGYLDSLD